jgi:hypothetical protein
MSTALFVATHKPVRFNLPPEYHWVQVNAARNGCWEGYLHDSDGEDNISEKNPSYCELTALYLLWKTSQADFAGLCHYRRFLGKGCLADLAEVTGTYIKKRHIQALILEEKDIKRDLQSRDIILARHYFPYPVNVYENLLRFVYPADIEALVRTIRQDFPEYTETLQQVLMSSNISYCNMFITRRETLDRYCSWLFDVLGRVEKQVDISAYDAQHARVFGYLAEILLNVYVRHQGLSVKEVPTITLDEDDTPLSLQRRTIVSCYLLTTALGIAPERWRSRLWDSRVDHYRCRDHSAGYASSSPGKRLVNYFKTLGGKDVCVIGSQPLHIQSVFVNNTVHAFCVDETTDTAALFREIDRIRTTPRPFAAGHPVRIYKNGVLPDTMNQAILHHGFFFIENTPWGYYCSLS